MIFLWFYREPITGYSIPFLEPPKVAGSKVLSEFGRGPYISLFGGFKHHLFGP